ncbi:MAG: ABC transporter ATP-binding protein [Paludibacteraceae bacterium]
MAIVCDNLSIGYQGKIVQPSLSFTLHEGELVCMLGRNGCGKSTLLRTIAGLLPPVSGRYIIQTNVEKATCGNVALVLSSDDAIEKTTVFDIVAMGRYPYTSLLGTLTPRDRQVIEDALLAVGLPGNDKTWCASDYMAHSDGEKQRILIAKAIAQQTPVILLDEPTAHLDLPNRIRILLLLKQLAHDQRKTILISTHELDLAVKTADRILLLAPSMPFRLNTPERLIDSNAFTEAFGMDIFSLRDL